MTPSPNTDWGGLSPDAAAAIERAVGRGLAVGLEELLTDPERLERVMGTVVEVAKKRGAEESGRWLWKKIIGALWWAAKGAAVAALYLYFGGGWPAVVAFFKAGGKP